MAIQGETRVGVIGATGYAGAELVRLLCSHPNVKVTYLAASSDSGSLAQTYPNLSAAALPPVMAYDEAMCRDACDLAFVALPSGRSGRIAVELWQKGLRVIDLSGDLRLPPDVYEEWYPHTAEPNEAIDSAVYGLTEWAREEIREAALIANPGCYATAVLLGLLPLQKKGWLSGQTVYVDAKSGISGAGKSAKTEYLFTELEDNFKAYKLGSHQHTPEIEQLLQNESKVILTTQLLPTTRGIYASLYVPLTGGLEAQAVADAFAESYRSTPFVHVLGHGKSPQLKAVRGCNSCHIGWHLDSRTNTLLVMSAIDNLQKGAAGQALQNFNVMCGYEETAGLQSLGIFP